MLMEQTIGERILVEVLDMKKEMKQLDVKLTNKIQEVETKLTKQIQEVRKELKEEMQAMDIRLIKEIRKNRKLLEENMKDQGEINRYIMQDAFEEKKVRVAEIRRLEGMIAQAN